MMKIIWAILIMMTIGCGGREMVGRGKMREMNGKSIGLVMERKGEWRVYCSGVWVGEKEIMTAGHCVEDGEGVWYVMEGDIKGVDEEPGVIRGGRVVEWDGEKDLAVIRVDKSVGHMVAEIGNGVEVGERMGIIGHVRGLWWTYMEGMVSGVRKNMPSERMPEGISGVELVQVQAPVWYGNSGGGLFNGDGEVVGICSHMSGVPGEAMFIGWKEMRRMAHRADIKGY